MSTAETEPEDEGATFDVDRVREWTSYALRAVRRRRWTFLVPALLIAATTIALATAIPFRFRAEAKLLAQRSDAIAALSNPMRPQSADSRSTSQAESEVLRRDNLVAIISETGLLEQWRQSRPLPLRLKDWVVFGGVLGDQELLDVLVGTLEKRLQVTTWPQEDGSSQLTFTVVWNDRNMSYRLLDSVVRRFVESRHAYEMAVVGESITLLEERLREARQQLDEALSGARAATPRRPGILAAPPSASPQSNQREIELARIRAALLAKRRAIEDLEAFRQRRLGELQTQLAEQRAVYSESHPAVLNTQRSIQALGADSPQTAQLRQEAADLEQRYVAAGGSPSDLGGGSGRGGDAAPIIAALDGPVREPGEEYSRSRLTAAIARYYSVADRLEAARMERDATQAESKFRYLVVWPPMRPKKPMNAGFKWAIALFGIVSGVLVGALAAIAAQVREGRIEEPWQVERSLGLPVLASLPRGSAVFRDQEQTT